MDGLGQLARDHPALYDYAPDTPTQSSRRTWASALIEDRVALALLDGLDELPETARCRALHDINQVLRPGQPLALSTRTAHRDNVLRAR